MRAGNRVFLLLAVLLVSASRMFAGPTDGTGGHIAERVRHLLLASLVNDHSPAPQAIPAADSNGPAVDPSHLDHPAELERKLRSALRNPLSDTRLTVTGGSARLGHYSVGSDQAVHGHVVVLKGNAEIHGRVEGNVVALDGDVTVFPGGAIVGDVLAIGGRVQKIGDGSISGATQELEATAAAPRAVASVPVQILRHAAGLVGLLLTLTVLGFGMVTFGRPNLEIVSDTVTSSFGRSFLTGLLGQVLVLPTFGMLVVGLVLTIAGAVLLPFAVAVFAILVVVTALIGLIAVAHAMGERVARRQMARGLAISPNSYRYVLTGLGAVATLWLAWVFLGWVPVAGSLMLGAAGFVTWSLATVGFGAALLSRGGILEQFAGRLIPAEMMTDEYLWATPQYGVPAINRPTRRND